MGNEERRCSERTRSMNSAWLSLSGKQKVRTFPSNLGLRPETEESCLFWIPTLHISYLSARPRTYYDRRSTSGILYGHSIVSKQHNWRIVLSVQLDTAFKIILCVYYLADTPIDSPGGMTEETQKQSTSKTNTKQKNTAKDKGKGKQVPKQNTIETQEERDERLGNLFFGTNAKYNDFTPELSKWLIKQYQTVDGKALLRSITKRVSQVPFPLFLANERRRKKKLRMHLFAYLLYPPVLPSYHLPVLCIYFPIRISRIRSLSPRNSSRRSSRMISQNLSSSS